MSSILFYTQRKTCTPKKNVYTSPPYPERFKCIKIRERNRVWKEKFNPCGRIFSSLQISASRRFFCIQNGMNVVSIIYVGRSRNFFREGL